MNVVVNNHGGFKPPIAAVIIAATAPQVTTAIKTAGFRKDEKAGEGTCANSSERVIVVARYRTIRSPSNSGTNA